MLFRWLCRLLREYPLAAVAALSVLWSEWIALEVRGVFWDSPRRPANSTCILVVSDPQLIGYNNEPWWIGWLSRWDSDRYLRRGYAKAMSVVDPDLVIFMGDLLDEGVGMTEAQFIKTRSRFQSIFPASSADTIHIPGDNDIGGEMERIYPSLVNRFAENFPLFVGNASRYPNFNIAVINVLDENRMKEAVTGSGLRLLLSHLPVMRTFSRSTKEVVENYKPDLILSAHEHEVNLYVKPRSSAAFERSTIAHRMRFLLAADHPVVEFETPTVSYRMGVPTMGYGVVVVTPSGTATNEWVSELDVLYVPGRYPQLYLYVVVLLVTLFHFLRCACLYVCDSKRAPSGRYRRLAMDDV